MIGLQLSIWFGSIYGAHGSPGVPTGAGVMDFSIATGDNTGLLAILEDI